MLRIREQTICRGNVTAKHKKLFCIMIMVLNTAIGFLEFWGFNIFGLTEFFFVYIIVNGVALRFLWRSELKTNDPEAISDENV